MKMEQVDPIMVEDGVEEAGERRNQPRIDAVQEEGVEDAVHGSRLGGANPERYLPPSLSSLSIKRSAV